MRKRIKLSTPYEVRRSLSKIANAVYNNELDPRHANCIVAACNVILSAIRTDEMEQRLQELERMVNDGGTNG